MLIKNIFVELNIHCYFLAKDGNRGKKKTKEKKKMIQI